MGVIRIILSLDSSIISCENPTESRRIPQDRVGLRRGGCYIVVRQRKVIHQSQSEITPLRYVMFGDICVLVTNNIDLLNNIALHHIPPAAN